ncbi:alpha/beta hydrolase family protein [Pleomorphovibrio marinus]|uniref:alpha/beta hydrolase family protein n=1 Tax=Pleomorphovibrio marinus TaxID=2164132 RepID=UPI0013006827|nr:alpha/beta hydrolase [Pleomorphovibrio marinus]
MKYLSKNFQGLIFGNFLLILFVVFPIRLNAQVDLTGTWKGELDLGPQKLPLLIHIETEEGKLKASMDSPEQNAFKIPINEVLYDGLMLLLRLNNLGASYEGIWNGKSFQGQFKQSGMSFALELVQSDQVTEQKNQIPKPQEPSPPYPYETLSTTFISGENALRGTVTKPKGLGPFPAVVLISGSGPQDRDAAIFGHKPFLVIADFLTRNDIVVLRYDERGVGESEGEFESGTTYDFAKDAKAAMEKLKGFEFTDKDKIGLIGHSEGGLITWMLSSENTKHPNFIIALAPPVVPIMELMAQQTLDITLGAGVDSVMAEEQVRQNRRLYRSVAEADNKEEAVEKLSEAIVQIGIEKGFEGELLDHYHQQMLEAYTQLAEPWFYSFIKMDPEPWISQIKIPVFAAFGEKDKQVEAGSNLAKLIRTLPAKRSHKMEIYPGLNHLFQEAETGSIAEYAEITETFNTRVMEEIVEWIKSLN